MEEVDDYIYRLPEELRDVAQALRSILLSISPSIEEKYSYKVPFYYYHGPLCYINKMKDHIYIGFVKGYELDDEYDLLEKGDRKMVRIIRYGCISDIEKSKPAFYINQAMILNEIRKKTKVKYC